MNLKNKYSKKNLCTQDLVFAGTEVSRSDLKIQGSNHISWYHSSEKVRRGFCSVCGSSLFFDPLDQVKHKWIGISMGAFDGPTNTKLSKHIFVAEKKETATK